MALQNVAMHPYDDEDNEKKRQKYVQFLQQVRLTIINHLENVANLLQGTELNEQKAFDRVSNGGRSQPAAMTDKIVRYNNRVRSRHHFALFLGTGLR